jgi:cytidylate kinase
MIITISRQYRAGASAVAARLAESLEWTVVDDAFIDAIAERSGLTPEDVRKLEESVPSFMERFAQSSALSFPEFLVSTPAAIEEPEVVKLAHVSRDFIEELGHRNRIVMVGRAAAAVLASERDAIHVRLVASREYRIGLTMAEFNISESEAAETVDWPGAITSGLIRPSATGPREEKDARMSAETPRPVAPTAMTFLAVAGLATVPVDGPLFPAANSSRKSG